MSVDADCKQGAARARKACWRPEQVAAQKQGQFFHMHKGAKLYIEFCKAYEKHTITKLK